MVLSDSPGADPGTDDGTDDETGDDVAAGLRSAMTAEELRRFAAHSDASRSRGADKSTTAIEVAEGDPELAAVAAAGGDFEVSCSCGLRFRADHPQTALSEAEAHKSDNPTHWPRAADESGDDDVVLYGR